MKKYKICVYAICKNESKFIKRWYESIKGADYICVLDTGSEDDSLKILKSLNIKVKQKVIKPWRFDTARNESMKLIPKDTDICICLDIDEIILPGWKEELYKIWNDKITRINYKYNWSLDENDKPIISFYANKIHKNGFYKWTHPVHEILSPIKEESSIVTDNIIINHYPDITKSRSNYLPLLELSVKEDPTDDRNMHYLGREYMYYKKWNKCIDTLIKHLSLPKATWKDERCASMRFIATSYINLKRYDKDHMWLDKAMAEAPYLRDPFIERAILEHSFKNYEESIKYGKKALKIKTRKYTYINSEHSWDETIYDIMSINYYMIGNKKEGLKYLNKALKINPNNIRIKDNKKYFISKNSK